MSSNEQSIEKWKQKYYDQLDRLEKREEDWEKLEATLKRTIGRLSLAAEGQHSSLDRHISELRNTLKNKVDRTRLESVVDDISRILSQLEESDTKPERTSISIIEQLLSPLELPESQNKTLKKLIKKFKKSTDDQYDLLLKESINLLKITISNNSPETTSHHKSGFLNRLLHSKDDNSKNNSHTQIQPFAHTLSDLLLLIPWPDSITNDSMSIINDIKKSTDENSLLLSLQRFEDILKLWPDNSSNARNTSAQQLETYKTCLIELLNKLDNSQSPNGKLTALKISTRDAQQKSELDNLSDQLFRLLAEQSNNTKINSSKTLDAPVTNYMLQPSIQELLIRLLEQLIVPANLQDDVDAMKNRLGQETEPSNWKLLLKDVAVLITSIRSRMQKEKHEFESFLQQVTDRLKAMDQFLQVETTNLQQAEAQGSDFDQKMHIDVNEIRQNVSDATELSSLKQSVNSKLDTISEHIKHYREVETSRVEQSQEQVNVMHSRMQTLEHETEVLKQTVIEKNKLAMIDTLTAIPNRLAYEKKIEEEISRWMRFHNPLSLAIWDIDLFKKVNDTYGHKAGDKVLKTVAQLLNKRIRSTDFLARYGGEEFIMLLPGTRQEETLRLVNDLRQQIENCGFHNHGDSVNITISCGISSFNEGDTLSQVFERADKALYKAKKNGRNQCIAAACLSD